MIDQALVERGQTARETLAEPAGRDAGANVGEKTDQFVVGLGWPVKHEMHPGPSVAIIGLAHFRQVSLAFELV